MSIFLSALAAVAIAQVPTTPSRFLTHEGAVYVPSPIFAVKAATADERMKWSADGSRLAVVSSIGEETPSAAQRRIEQGLPKPDAKVTVGVWSHDTGRYREVLIPAQPVSIDDFVFVGKDLVVRFSESLWMVRDGGQATRLPFEGGPIHRIVPSIGQRALLIVAGQGLWKMGASGVEQIRTPAKPYLSRGLTDDDRVILFDGQGWLLYDFSNGSLSRADREPTPRHATFPFVLDAYRMTAAGKADLLNADPDSPKLDSRTTQVSEEDGGYSLDLVERTAGRRRLSFVGDMAKSVEVSNDGLSFAFISGRTLFVRTLVKLDKEAAAKLAGGDNLHLRIAPKL